MYTHFVFGLLTIIKNDLFLFWVEVKGSDAFLSLSGSELFQRKPFKERFTGENAE